MKVHKWKDIKRQRFTPEKLEEIDRDVEAELLEMNLQALRDHLHLTQEAVARAAKMTQSELSRAERRDDHLVSSLRRLVKAMGGELRVTAVFGSKEIRLSGV